jgi:putative transposase
MRSMAARWPAGTREIVSPLAPAAREVGADRGGEGNHHRGAQLADCVRIVHYARNLLGQVGAGKRKELAGGLRQVFAASTPTQARAACRELADAWRATHPKVARSLEEESEACFACLAFPLAHQARIRTTNGLERFNQELKRRTRVVRIFPNRAACLRLVTALCAEQSDEWVSGRRYLDLAELGSEDTPETMLGREEGTMQLVG